jgi:hypothetical protein
MLKAHTTTACGVCDLLASRVYLGLGKHPTVGFERGHCGSHSGWRKCREMLHVESMWKACAKQHLVCLCVVLAFKADLELG